MKLIRFREEGKVKPGVIIDDVYYDTSGFGEDYNEHFFESDGLTRLRQFVNQQNGTLTRISSGVSLDSPFARPSKIVCIGLNYADHAKETGAALPPEPVIFFKSTTA